MQQENFIFYVGRGEWWWFNNGHLPQNSKISYLKLTESYDLSGNKSI